MIKFKHYVTHLSEAVRSSDFPKVAKLVQSYISRNVGKAYYFPQPEVFVSRGKTGVGVRFFMANQSFRLNWIRTIDDSMGLESVDHWDGSKIGQSKPSHHIEFDQHQSLAKTLPFLRDFLQGKIKAGGVFVNEEVETQEALTEAVYTPEQLLKTVHNMMNAMKMGIQIRQQQLEGGNTKYGPKWNDAQRIVREMYPELFKARPGSKQLIIDKEDVDKIDAKQIVARMTGAGSSSISFAITPGQPEVIDVPGTSAADLDRMTYEEQLDALKTGMKLLMSNATNALFVGGRGGTGKTQTVEDMLHEAGKEDGDGYFKITGSATPVGIYRILHTHRKDIILFDDSDSALNDQEGRNLFKAASDTKRVRKISWMKGGKNFVDPESYDEESEDEDTLPRYFEFTGKIIFISNLTLNKLDPDGALRTRGYVINVDPTNEEIYDFMLKIVDKIPLDVNYALSKEDRMEVVEVLRSRRIADKSANLRSLVRGLNTRAGVEQQGGSDEEWKKFVKMFA